MSAHPAKTKCVGNNNTPIIIKIINIFFSIFYPFFPARNEQITALPQKKGAAFE
jgi:hypothetical protein